MTDRELIQLSLRLAGENVAAGGGPFGAVIARGGEVISTGVNRVTTDHDPTAHAEIIAIRCAALLLGRHSLSDCEIYASCEPCPMCLGAIYWARLHRLVYAASRDDAASAGFDDAFIYRELPLPPNERSLPADRISGEAGKVPFQLWLSYTKREEY